jgi:hypothetical protein
MKILRYLLGFIISFIFLVLFVPIWMDSYKNSDAYSVQKTIIEALNDGFKRTDPIDVENIGGIGWETVCFISYELNGIDVSDGLDIPVRYMKIPRKTFSQVANDYFTEFKSSRYGLVFFSTDQKILVAVVLKDSEPVPASECHSAKGLMLHHSNGKHGRSLVLKHE